MGLRRSARWVRCVARVEIALVVARNGLGELLVRGSLLSHTRPL